jgi:hypothetical protein
MRKGELPPSESSITSLSCFSAATGGEAGIGGNAIPRGDGDTTCADDTRREPAEDGGEGIERPSLILCLGCGGRAASGGGGGTLGNERPLSTLAWARCGGRVDGGGGGGALSSSVLRLAGADGAQPGGADGLRTGGRGTYVSCETAGSPGVKSGGGLASGGDEDTDGLRGGDTSSP